MKLYIITRADLTPGARAAQSCHTLHTFIHEHPDYDKEWSESSNNLVVLEMQDEQALQELWGRAQAAKIPSSFFREPDFDNALTGVAMGHQGAFLVSSTRLALRDVGSLGKWMMANAG